MTKKTRWLSQEAKRKFYTAAYTPVEPVSNPLRPKYLAYIIPIICKNWERFK